MDPTDQRAGDSDRTRALDKLGTYFVEGYLDVTEFEERTSCVISAKTRGELTKLFADLPQQQSDTQANLATSQTKSAVSSYNEAEFDAIMKRFARRLKAMQRKAIILPLIALGIIGVQSGNLFPSIDWAVLVGWPLAFISFSVATVFAVKEYRKEKASYQ